MAKKGSSKRSTPRNCRDCENWGEVSNKIRVHDLVENALKQFEAKIHKAGFEPTVAEYVKLLQLGQELGQEDEPKEIKVTWVGPKEMSDAEK